jgi:hypothetical protein
MGSRFGDGPILVRLKLLVLDRPPAPLDENIIVVPAPAVYADPDAVSLQDARELRARKLISLTRVENLRLRRTWRRQKRIQTELLLQRRRPHPRQRGPAVPVHGGHEKDEAVGQSDVPVALASGRDLGMSGLDYDSRYCFSATKTTRLPWLNTVSGFPIMEKRLPAIVERPNLLKRPVGIIRSIEKY